MRAWWRAFKTFMKAQDSALPWDRKLKGIFWFIVRADWVRAVQQTLETHDMAYVGQRVPYLYYTHRLESFVQHGEGLPERLERILCHLRSLKRYFSDEQIRQLFGKGLPVLESKIEGRSVALVLRYEHGMRHEGLFSLILFVEEAYTYYLHLSLCEETFYIGGVQGSTGQKEAIRFLTRATSGLRPQNLMVFALMALARQLGIRKIVGINPRFHALKESERGRHIQFDYREFWEELGMATPEAEPWWLLPSRYPMRPLEEIKAKKRSQYRKRYALMAELEEAIAQRFGVRTA